MPSPPPFSCRQSVSMLVFGVLVLTCGIQHLNTCSAFNPNANIRPIRESTPVFARRGNDESDGRLPFVIERLGERPNKKVYKDIADMCISVFFNNGRPFIESTPWKLGQLNYLRWIQAADLQRRREGRCKQNAMFVAYKVEPASSTAALSQPLILNLNKVYNKDLLDGEETDFVRDEVLGFCEVTIQEFGLSPRRIASSSSISYKEEFENQRQRSKSLFQSERPILTNLSVRRDARRSGVGSTLLQACEQVAKRQWGRSEMVLEVEDDNVDGENFYKKRGYKNLYSDPASRRYNVNGFFLRKVRCTRQVMRKALGDFQPVKENSGLDESKAKFRNPVNAFLQLLR